MVWKNGGGKTQEILIWPPGASVAESDFLWRLSSATIEADGPFSTFPDCERLLTLIQGRGIELTLDHQALRPLKCGEVLRFSGAAPASCRLISGPVSDLGLIFNRKLSRTQLSLLEIGVKPRSFQLDTPTTLLFALEGPLQISLYPGEREYHLQEGDTFFLDGTSSQNGAKENQEQPLILLSSPSRTRVALFEVG